MAAGRTTNDDGAPAAKRRGRPVDHDSHETRATIIITAQRLFGRAGLKGVTMERLARECDLTVRALYHYFPSKQDLFRAATDEALERFGVEIVNHVFVHDALRDRIRGFIGVYRSLHESDPHVLSFIGMALIDAISDDIMAGGQKLSDASKVLEHASLPVKALNEILLADALARGELAEGVAPEGARALLEMLGMGLGLAALGETGSFLPMLDVLERLTEGTLYRDPLTPA